MNKLYCVLCFLLVCSCSSRNERLLREMESIKEVGNDAPIKAMASLDSLQPQIEKANEYTRNKSELLRIRLQDKADIIATSDSVIKSLVTYFVKNRYQDDLQEVYYYAGSVYRDLQDSPNALRYFLESENQAKKIGHPDSLMLRNTYSQLYLVYYRVQDYKNALVMARNEAKVAEELGVLDARTVFHEGASLIHLDSMEAALHVFKRCLEDIEENGNSNVTLYNELVPMIYYFSVYDSLDDARRCRDLLLKFYPSMRIPKGFYHSMGSFYLADNQVDSAKCYLQKGVLEGSGLDDRYTAAKMLFYLYKREGNLQQSNHYADIFIERNDSLNFGQRQELAATVNNQFKYYKNEAEDKKMQEENERNRLITVMVSSFSLIVLLLFLAVYVYQKNKSLRRIIRKDLELKNIKATNQELHDELVKQELMLADIRTRYQEKQKEIASMTQKMETADAELDRTRQQLDDKELQSRQLLRLLSQKTLEESAYNILQLVKQAANGKYILESADWLALRSAVSELYPAVNERILQLPGKEVSDQLIKLLDLMCIGLSNTEIENVTGLSKATVWRWTKKYKDVIQY